MEIYNYLENKRKSEETFNNTMNKYKNKFDNIIKFNYFEAEENFNDEERKFFIIYLTNKLHNHLYKDAVI